MRLNALELLMLLLVAALGAFVVVPRVTAAQPQVQASRARALAVELDTLTARWLNAGGLAGPGQADRLALTLELLRCFTSPAGRAYTSPAGTHPYNYVGEPTTACAALRLAPLSGCALSFGTLPSGLRVVFIGGQFAALFDGTHWQVWPQP